MPEMLPYKERLAMLRHWREEHGLSTCALYHIRGGHSLLNSSRVKTTALCVVKEFEEDCCAQGIVPPDRKVWPEIVDRVARRANTTAKSAFGRIEGVKGVGS